MHALLDSFVRRQLHLLRAVQLAHINRIQVRMKKQIATRLLQAITVWKAQRTLPVDVRQAITVQ